MYPLSETIQQAIQENRPQRVLFEFDGGDTVFSNEDISVTDGFKLVAPFNAENELTVGMTPCAELRFRMLNQDGELAEFGFGRFKAWLGIQIVTGTPAAGAKTKTFTEHGRETLYEFSPLGTFIASRPNVVTKNMIDVVAYDQMRLFEKAFVSAAELGVTYPTTLVQFVNKMIDYINTQESADIGLKSENFLNANLAITAHPKDYENKTFREVLAWCAEAAGSIARFTRDGDLEMAWFAPSSRTYTMHDYTEYTPYWYEVGQIDNLHVRNQDETAESVVTQTNDNPYVIQGNPFLT